MSFVGTEPRWQPTRSILRNRCSIVAFSLLAAVPTTHLLILDFRSAEFTGKDVAQALARAGIIGNFNMVPGDHRKPFVTSGVRLGTPALTSMGMKEPEMEKVAGWIHEVCQNMDDLDATTTRIRAEIAEFCGHFAIPGIRDAAPATS